MFIELHRLQRDARRISDRMSNMDPHDSCDLVTDADFKFITGYPRIRRGLCPSKLRALGPGVLPLFQKLAYHAGLLKSPDIWLNAGYSVGDLREFGFRVSHLWYFGYSLFSLKLCDGEFAKQMERDRSLHEMYEHHALRQRHRARYEDRGPPSSRDSFLSKYDAWYLLRESDAHMQVIYPNVLMFFSLTAPLNLNPTPPPPILPFPKKS